MGFIEGKSYKSDQCPIGSKKSIKIEKVTKSTIWFEDGKSARIKDSLRAGVQFFVYQFSEKRKAKVFSDNEDNSL